jgi:hypothetical protein
MKTADVAEKTACVAVKTAGFAVEERNSFPVNDDRQLQTSSVDTPWALQGHNQQRHGSKTTGVAVKLANVACENSGCRDDDAGVAVKTALVVV